MTDTTFAQHTQQIAQLNDRVRREPRPGEILATQGVTALGMAAVAAILQQLAAFDRCNAGNDPYGEHDFGVIEVADVRVFWKIDCYDLSLTGGCATPWDDNTCQRVLTLMLPQEY